MNGVRPGFARAFEAETGALRVIPARDFSSEVKDKAFLTVLSAYISATPGPTEFSNLAALEQGMPYALADVFFGGRSGHAGVQRAATTCCCIPVETAVTRARRELAYDNPRAWAVGVAAPYMVLDRAGQASGIRGTRW